MRIEAPHVAKDSRAEGARAFEISKAGNGMEIITLGAVHEIAKGTGEVRIAWENQNLKFEQPPDAIAEIVGTSDSNHALEELSRLGVILVDPNEFGQRWPNSVLRSFQEGIRSGALVLEGSTTPKADGEKGKVAP